MSYFRRTKRKDVNLCSYTGMPNIEHLNTKQNKR
jgi:hypothetical protein